MDRGTKHSDRQLDAVIDRAIVSGPQRIVREADTVVVIRSEDYERLTGGRSKLKRLLFEGPSLDGLDLSRDISSPRDVDFGTG